MKRTAAPTNGGGKKGRGDEPSSFEDELMDMELYEVVEGIAGEETQEARWARPAQDLEPTRDQLGKSPRLPYSLISFSFTVICTIYYI